MSSSSSLKMSRTRPHCYETTNGSIPPMSPAFRQTVVIALVGISLASGVALRLLSEADWDPTIFVAFGEDATATNEYAEERLGEVWLRTFQGHDGKFFFVQANDPWVLDPEENAAILDRPLYRSQRMLYPVLAGVGGVLAADGVVWGLLIINLFAVGLGTAAVGRLATEMGGSAWWGLSFVLNVGFISEMTIDGAGVVSAFFAFLAVLLVLHDRIVPAYFALSLAVLSREAMLVAAVGVAFWLWRNSRRREAAMAVALPAGAAILWAVYLRLRIDSETGVDQIQEIGFPFKGLVQAFEHWSNDPFDLAVGVAMVMLMVLYTRRTLVSAHLVGWAFLGFVPLGILFTDQVWNTWFDISRAIAPVITAYVLLLHVSTRNPEPGFLAKRTSVR